MSIKIAIAGYGNLGRGVECALNTSQDMELVGVFSRRDPKSIQTKTNVPVYHIDEAVKFKDDIDVMILCGGSANDLPKQTAQLAKYFNVIDSFDTHAKIPEHFADVDAVSKESKKISIISVGWDPGLFSLNRLYGQAVLPNGNDYTFWGKGVSQGHSDAIRRIEGVQDAKQYTIPVEEALESVRNGENPQLTTRQKHKRECFVVAKEGADLEYIENAIKTMPNYFADYDTTVHENPQLTTRQKHKRECFVVAKEGADLEYIENAIKTMPNYFADYDTTVHFISQEELNENHSGIPHGGIVFRTGQTGLNGENKHVIEYKLTLDSNPEFTSSVLVAYARAAYRLNKEGQCGCKTVFDIAPAYLHPSSPEELRKNLL